MPFGKRGPENSLVPHGSGPRHRSVVATSNGGEAEKLLEMELGFHSERSALRELSDAEFDRARGAEHLGRTTLDSDMFVETVSEAWWMNRRSALAAFTAAVPGGRIEGRMNRHQYLLLREAFVHGENIDHPVIKKLRLTAIWHRADVDHNGLITHNELINWLRHLCSSDSHVRACRASVARLGSAGPPAPRGIHAGTMSKMQNRITRVITKRDKDDKHGDKDKKRKEETDTGSEDFLAMCKRLERLSTERIKREHGEDQWWDDYWARQRRRPDCPNYCAGCEFGC